MGWQLLAAAGGQLGTVPGPTGYDLRRAARLTFWVRGATGAERVQFLVGGISGQYGDSLGTAVKTPVLRLSTAWRQVTITLAGEDLTHIIGGSAGWRPRRTIPRGRLLPRRHLVPGLTAPEKPAVRRVSYGHGRAPGS